MPDEPIHLNLQTYPKPAGPPPVEQLQFRQAEPAEAHGEAASRRCHSCKGAIFSTYYQAQGLDVCPLCAERLQSGQQAPPAHSLAKAALYGGGAALAGCAIYATVAIVTGLELALVAILIGVMVGKAIRHASHGLGGRPQQILAVALTYFAITTSYIPVFVYHAAKDGKLSHQQALQKPDAQKPDAQKPNDPPKIMKLGVAIAAVLALASVAPFLELGSNIAGGLLSLLIIFFGLRQAWTLTGRRELLVTGPFSATVSAPSGAPFSSKEPA